MKCNIIIPCYNGGRLLEKNLPSLFDYVSKSKNEFNIYIVNDGSKDNTLEILNTFKNKINVLSYNKNSGKGGAVKYGILNCSNCDAVLFMDCDFATDLKAIDESLEEIKKGADAVIGSRFLKQSVLPVKRKISRRIVSKCCVLLINTIFRFKLKDIQCGFKVFKYDFIKHVATKQIISGWSFDVEYLYALKLNKKKIVELPIIWTEKNDSTVKLVNSSIKFIKSLFKIRKNKKNYYEEN